jgi:hypothetical protein
VSVVSNSDGGGSASGPTVTNPVPTQAPLVTDTGHQAFLLLAGEVIGVFVLAFVASLNDRLAVIIMAVFVILWLIWIMNNAGSGGVLQRWGSKVGL